MTQSIREPDEGACPPAQNRTIPRNQRSSTYALVTGGGGFLGRYIVEQLLRRGDRVTVFARGNYPELVAQGVHLVRGDLRDRDAIVHACQGAQIVYHVAAKAGLWGPWDDFYTVNVIGTENVIAACQANNIRRLVFTSSPSVIFDGHDQQGLNEDVPYPAHYENPYPATKALAEQMVRSANNESLMTVSLRPHLIFGPRDNHLLPALIARARKGMVPQVGDGSNQVDLTYVEDAAYAHLLAADALQPGSPAVGPPGHGHVYFISQGEPVVLWQWIADLLHRLELPPVRLKLPLAAARGLGAAMTAMYRWLKLPGEPPLTPFLASELAQHHYYDISRARDELSYAPRFTMQEAAERTIQWLREQHIGADPTH